MGTGIICLNPITIVIPMKIVLKRVIRIVVLTSAFMSVFALETHAAPPVFNLADLDGTNGFMINGLNVGDQSGFCVSPAGDLNGDGTADFLISSPFAVGAADPWDPVQGQSYVVFGTSGSWPATFDLSTLDGTNGFAINGVLYGSTSGNPLSAIGDFNGDGIDDILIRSATPKGFSAGQCYVLFGSSASWPAVISLSDLDGTTGFAINGANADDHIGFSFAAAGDFNGDGIKDIVIGAPDGNLGAGLAYVLFGSATPWPVYFYLETLDGTNGFAINGINAGDFSGFSVSGAADFNGDIIEDIIIGAPGANTLTGESYVVFGGVGPWAASFNLVDLDGTNGFVITGINTGDESGHSVTALGDMNGDSIGDFLIGSHGFGSNKGQSYIVFGSAMPWLSSTNLASLDGFSGFAITGVNAGDDSGLVVGRVGDFNGDSLDDFLIGAPGANSNTGQSYMVYGSSAGWVTPINLSGLDGTNGFAINGIVAGDNSGFSLHGIGDINGDSNTDIIIGAKNAIGDTGQSYVLFGGFVPERIELKKRQ